MKLYEFIRIMVARRQMALALIVTFILAASLLISGCVADQSPTPDSTNFAPAITDPIPNEPIAASDTLPVASLYNEEAMVTLYNQAISAVVEINTVVGGDASAFGVFGIPNIRGQGSGFLIDEQGHILTNNHVVDNASSVTVTLHSGKKLEGEVLGTDRENDLALVQVDPAIVENIIPLPWTDSDNVKPGQMAIALGSPFGLEGSITVGIVSGLGRTVTGAETRSIPNMLQTDAAINPGNSGGPLLDSKGMVMGINTAIEASSTGIGFAIPINNAKSLLPSLLQGGEVDTPWLGISGTAIDQSLATELNLSTDHGVYVVSVVPDSPAGKVGLIPGGSDQGRPTSGGDIITEVDGVEVTEVSDILQYFNTKKVEDQINLTIIRGDETITVDLTLSEWPKDSVFQELN